MDAPTVLRNMWTLMRSLETSCDMTYRSFACDRSAMGISVRPPVLHCWEHSQWVKRPRSARIITSCSRLYMDASSTTNQEDTPAQAEALWPDVLASLLLLKHYRSLLMPKSALGDLHREGLTYYVHNTYQDFQTLRCWDTRSLAPLKPLDWCHFDRYILMTTG